MELGDTFLLCSDGLTGLVEDDEIGPILASLPPTEAAQALTDLANLRGGHDNITVIVVRVTGAAMTTQGARAEPLTIRREKRRTRSNPALWIISSVCFLVALAMAVLSKYTTALVALAVGLIAVLGAVIQRWIVMPRNIAIGEARRFGKGPYVTVACPVGAELIGRLAALVDQLRSATQGGHWVVNMQKFETQCRAAEQAAGSSQHVTALKRYISAISFMMSELREQARRGHNPLPPGPTQP